MLQIWVFPNKDDEGVWIYQNAWFHLGELDKKHTEKYELKNSGDGLYIFVIEGDISVDKNKQNRKDAIAITGADNVTIHTDNEAKILIMEIQKK